MKTTRTDRLLGWISCAVMFAIALGLRLWKLGRPDAFGFDETYYAKNAWALLQHGYARGYVDDANQMILDGKLQGIFKDTPEMIVHPEVGKWIIAIGEHFFGMTPFGWRVASAVVGALMVVVMMRLAMRLTGSAVLGVAAGVLMCFDGLQFVLSRLALLDLFQAFFILCAVAALAADRAWLRNRLDSLTAANPPSVWGPLVLWRPWRLLAGLWWGLALGTKWSTLYVLAAFGILLWLWDAGARRRIGVKAPVLRSMLTDALPALGYVVVFPVFIYVLTWSGWIWNAHAYEVALSHTQYGPYWGDYTKHKADGFARITQGLRSLWHYHHDVYSFHTKFLNTATHTYQSNPWGWLILNRPVGVDAQLNISPGAQGCDAATGSTCLRQVLLLGNPVVWWFGTAAALWSVVAWIGKRDWRYGIVVVGIAATWLPWLRYADRPIFSYYSITILPFLVLGATLLLGEILGPPDATAKRRAIGATIAGSVLVLTLVAFIFFWPIWTDELISNADWAKRMFFKRWI